MPGTAIPHPRYLLLCRGRPISHALNSLSVVASGPTSLHTLLPTVRPVRWSLRCLPLVRLRFSPWLIRTLLPGRLRRPPGERLFPLEWNASDDDGTDEDDDDDDAVDACDEYDEVAAKATRREAASPSR